MNFDIKYFIKSYYKYIIAISVIIILFIFFYLNDKSSASKIDSNDFVSIEETKEETKEENIEEKTNTIKVDIKGAVNNPGVYTLIENSRVEDIILLANGLKEEADTSTINLSKTLKDEMVIIIYTKDEIKKLTVGNNSVKVIEKECICPVIKNNACINENNLTDNNSKNQENNEIETKININTADLKKLMTLSGIGESKANEIINYRKVNGNFKTIEDIKKVNGIGTATFEKIKEDITV